METSPSDLRRHSKTQKTLDTMFAVRHTDVMRFLELIFWPIGIAVIIIFDIVIFLILVVMAVYYRIKRGRWA